MYANANCIALRWVTSFQAERVFGTVFLYFLLGVEMVMMGVL
jgi:hypothetical protein